MDAGSGATWIASTLVGIVVLVIGYLWRQLDSVRTKENERRLNELAAALTLVTNEKTKIAEQLRLNDLDTVRLQGRLALLEASHTERDKDIDGVRDQLRQQVEILRKVEGRVNEIAGWTAGRGRSYASPPPGAGTSDPRIPAARPDRDRDR